MSYCTVPLTTIPNSTQTFKVTLRGGAKNANIRFGLRYNDILDCWSASITDNSTGKLLVDSMPVVCGENLLGQYQYLGIGEAYIVQTTDTSLQQPDNKTLGTAFDLVWGDAS